MFITQTWIAIWRKDIFMYPIHVIILLLSQLKYIDFVSICIDTIAIWCSISHPVQNITETRNKMFCIYFV